MFQDTQIETLIKNKYNVIFSNVDALYMDCGFSAFIGKGNNWCSPYKSECIHKLMGDPFPLNESSVKSEQKKNTKKTWVKEDFVF